MHETRRFAGGLSGDLAIEIAERLRSFIEVMEPILEEESGARSLQKKNRRAKPAVRKRVRR